MKNKKSLREMIIEYLYDKDMTLEDKMSTVLIFTSFVGLLAAIFESLMTKASMLQIIFLIAVTFVTMVLLICQLKNPARIGRIKVCNTIIILLVQTVILLLAPDFNTAMIVWYIYEIVYLSILYKGIHQKIALITSVLLMLLCFSAHTQFNIDFDVRRTPIDIYHSVMLSVLIVSVSMVIIINWIKKLYKQEAELTKETITQFLESNERLLSVTDDLNKANKSQQIFLKNISHEMRTPLNAVLGFNQIIGTTDDIEEIRKYSIDIKESGNNLLRMINDLLEFSQIQSGNIKLNNTEYELRTILKDCLAEMKPYMKGKNIKLRVQNNVDMKMQFIGDIERITHCLMQLTRNAATYTKEGEINITTNLEPLADNKVKLWFIVKDTGIGISEENLKVLYDSFTRFNSDYDQSLSGTGLGLSIVKSLVSKMNGEIFVNSVLGVGSEFKFYVIQDSYRKVETKSVQNTFDFTNKRILAVDDVDLNLQVIKGLLKSTNADITTVTSGREAIELCRTVKYDVILLDHMMPEMDGIETFTHIKETINEKTKTIMVTANAVNNAKSQYLELGFDNYLPKPVVRDDLLKMLKEYLEVV